MRPSSTATGSPTCRHRGRWSRRPPDRWPWAALAEVYTSVAPEGAEPLAPLLGDQQGQMVGVGDVGPGPAPFRRAAGHDGPLRRPFPPVGDRIGLDGHLSLG